MLLLKEVITLVEYGSDAMLLVCYGCNDLNAL